MAYLEAALRTFYDPWFESARTDNSEDVTKSAWEAAWNKKNTQWTSKVAARANEELNFEPEVHEQCPITENKDMNAQKMKLILKDWDAIQLSLTVKKSLQYKFVEQEILYLLPEDFLGQILPAH